MKLYLKLQVLARRHLLLMIFHAQPHGVFIWFPDFVHLLCLGYPGGEEMRGGVGFERGARRGQRITGREQRAPKTETVQQESQRFVSILRENAQISTLDVPGA